MSRWILAVVAFGFTFASVRADPKPLWEIDTVIDAKRRQEVRWITFAPDGKTLVAQIADASKPQDDLYPISLSVWDVATRKEKLNAKLGEQGYVGGAIFSNATTKTGSVLIAGKPSQEVRIADGVKVLAKGLEGRSIGVWFNSDSSDSLWLFDRGIDGFSLSYGKTPPLAPDPKMVVRDEWLTTELPGDWSEDRPVVTVNSDLTRLAISSRSYRKLTLYNLAVDDKLKLTAVAAVLDGHKASISTMRFSPDGNTLATGSWDTTVCLWDVTKASKDWEPRATISAGKYTVIALAFSPDGRTLAIATLDFRQANLYFLDVTAGKVVASHRIDGALMSVAYSPDGKTLVTGHDSARVKVWDAEALRNP